MFLSEATSRINGWKYILYSIKRVWLQTSFFVVLNELTNSLKHQYILFNESKPIPNDPNFSFL